ncbi:MAG: PHP domain-containing protein, partial [Candidatus Dormiibacterota bacterium]
MTSESRAPQELDDEAQSALGIAIRTLAEISYRLRVANELYRGRAFAEAAQSLIAQRPDLALAATQGRLQSLPGIGERIERVLLDVLDEGASGYLARLREEEGVTGGSPVSELSLAGYQGDLHVHTTWSDGKAGLPEMVLSARDHGYRCLAITDHSPRMTIVHGLDADRLEKQRQELAEVRQAIPEMTILQGIEVDINEDGSLDLPDDALAQLDLVIASPHLGLRMERTAMT